MATNDFLPFCATDTGTNLLTESEYTASAGRTSGNQPGIASSKLNNKALRQSSYVTGQLAQMLADITGANVLDDAVSARFLSQLKATLQAFPPQITKYTSSTGSHNITYLFFIASGNATAAATYTNNGVTYTVIATIAAGTVLKASGSGAPAVSGTLTKTGGTGDSTITFYAVRAPVYLRVRMVGGGGGGGGAGTSGTAGNGGAGGNSTFGTTLLVANGGGATTLSGRAAGAGGSASLGTGPTGLAISGASGSDGALDNTAGLALAGQPGSSSPFGGAGGGGSTNGGGTNVNAVANTGSGGGGGGLAVTATSSDVCGASGTSGGFVDALITTVLSTYAYAVGAAGTAGTAGTHGAAGGTAGAGLIEVTECYQ